MLLISFKTSAEKIDEMLFDGATVEQLAKVAKTTKASVYVHLTHLNGKGKAGRKSRKSD